MNIFPLCKFLLFSDLFCIIEVMWHFGYNIEKFIFYYRVKCIGISFQAITCWDLALKGPRSCSSFPLKRFLNKSCQACQTSLALSEILVKGNILNILVKISSWLPGNLTRKLDSKLEGVLYLLKK